MCSDGAIHYRYAVYCFLNKISFMKYTFPKLFSAIILTAVVSCMIIGCLCSCTSTKEVNKTVETVDSSYIKNLERKIAEQEITISNYEQQVKENQLNSVDFNMGCDTVFNTIVEEIINSGCPKERVDSFLTAIKRLQNKVKILADGSIEAEGNIDKATSSKERFEKTLATVIKEKNLLITELEQVKAELIKTKEAKEKSSKKKFLNQWWLFPAGIVVGFYICLKRKRIASFLRPVKSKL
jgi:hypothetical protein